MIESTDGAIVISGAEGVRAYDILSNRAALALTIRTGMELRRGFDHVASLVKRGYVSADVMEIKGKRKRQLAAYAQLDILAASLPGQTSRPIGGQS